NGLLVRERIALEAARNIDVVLFDKTGTLTKGEHGVTDIFAIERDGQAEVLKLAASAESESEHMIARGLVTRAKQDSVTLAPVTQFRALPGRGVQGVVGGAVIAVGGPNLLTERGISVPDSLHQAVEQAGVEGKTVIYVFKDDQLVGAIALADLVRDESRQAIERLRAMGVRVAMLTGDSDDVAKWVASELGITEYFAQVLPAKKAETVKRLQADGSRVAMVGDGVNDAPALTQADVGIAIGAGTDVAIESAGIILVRNDPRDVASIITLSRATYQKMIQNLFWATGYNVVAIPLAAGILANQGILLPPAVAAVLMSLSTVVVAANAVLLRKVEPQLRSSDRSLERSANE
ncbi:MAG: heavy metal translocating P-type ATPase, partial [Patescibacteria group bacterium]